MSPARRLPRCAVWIVVSGIAFVFHGVAVPAPAETPITLISPAAPDSRASHERASLLRISEMLASPNLDKQRTVLNELADDGWNARHFGRRIVDLAKSQDPLIRAASARVLCHRNSPELQEIIEDCLRRLLSDPDSRVREAALRALSCHRTVTESSGETALLLLNDPNGDVQYAAIEFLRKCPTLRKQALPQLCNLMKSTAKRNLMISLHFVQAVPLAWDAARLIGHTDGKLDASTRTSLEDVLKGSTDRRLMFIIALVLAHQSGTYELVEGIVRDTVHGTSRDQDAVLQELAISHLPVEFRIKLLLELSKSVERSGLQAGFELIKLNQFWSDARDELVTAASDSGMSSWLRAAITQWLAVEVE